MKRRRMDVFFIFLIHLRTYSLIIIAILAPQYKYQYNIITGYGVTSYMYDTMSRGRISNKTSNITTEVTIGIDVFVLSNIFTL